MSIRGATFLVIATVLASCAGPTHSPRSREQSAGGRQLPLQRRWNAGIFFQKENHPRVQRQITRCMNERGFRYVPVPVGTEYAESLASELAARDFRATFGYGIATARFNRILLQPFGPPDPNEAIRRDLGTREVRKYARALWGDGTKEKTVRFRGHSATIFPSSCLTSALRTIYGSQAAMARASLKVNAALGPLYDEIEKDRRIRRALAMWQRCMRGRGFDVAEFDEARDIARRKALSARGATALRRAQVFELRLARADGRCRSGAVEDTIFEVRSEYEREFLTRHERAIDVLWPLK